MKVEWMEVTTTLLINSSGNFGESMEDDAQIQISIELTSFSNT